MMLKRLLPLSVFLVLVVLMWKGLYHDPRKLPSPLLGHALPAFELPTLASAESVDSSILAHKVTLLNVFASWCEACLQEHPLLVDLKNRGLVNIVGLDYKDDPKQVKVWFSQMGDPYQTVLLDTTGNYAINLGVYGTPETFLIDKKGIIRYKYIGALDADVLNHQIIPEIQLLAQL